MSDLKALNILMNSPINQEMLQKLVISTLQVLNCKDDSSKQYPSPPSSPTATNGKPLPSLMTFISRLVRYTNVYTGTLMATMVYLGRLKSKLPQNAQGLPCTRHRIFLAALILSAKNHNDSSPKNIHWANYTDGLFDIKDINLMERQLLYLLDWDLRISNEEMCKYLAKFLEPIKADLKRTERYRRKLYKDREQQKLQLQHQLLRSPESLSLPGSPTYVAANHTRTNSVMSNSSSGSESDSSSYPSPELQKKLNNYVPITLPTSVPTNKQIPQSQQMHKIDPLIEIRALAEEQELDAIIRKYSSTVSGY